MNVDDPFLGYGPPATPSSEWPPDYLAGLELLDAPAEPPPLTTTWVVSGEKAQLIARTLICLGESGFSVDQLDADQFEVQFPSAWYDQVKGAYLAGHTPRQVTPLMTQEQVMSRLNKVHTFVQTFTVNVKQGLHPWATSLLEDIEDIQTTLVTLGFPRPDLASLPNIKRYTVYQCSVCDLIELGQGCEDHYGAPQHTLGQKTTEEFEQFMTEQARAFRRSQGLPWEEV